MLKAKLIVNGEREVMIEDGIVAAGRASDNTIPLADDTNVSRYHIEIETRGNEFWLIELGSSNGTTINGEKISDEKKLNDGDVILLGGSSEILFELEKEKTAEAAPPTVAPTPAVSAPSASAPSVSAPAVAAPAAITANTAQASKMPLMLGVAAVVCGLAVIAVLIAVVVSYSSGSGKCGAKATITSPENGDTISKETDIEVQSENDECVQKVVFLMDGVEFARTSEKPFKGTLDPAQFGDLSDGGNHSLRVALEDEKGEKIIQPGEVQLFFETLATPTPTPEPTQTPDVKPTQKTGGNTGGKTASTIEIQDMSRNLLSEFNGLPSYKFDSQFLQEVQKKTTEFSSDGYFSRAQNYTEQIKVGYIQGASLDAPLGFILAMSRTQFKMPNGGAEEGLWRMNTQLVTANGYNGTCEGEGLSDAKQNCSAKASALYMKALLINVFEGDLVYAVSAFGMSTQDAAALKSSLPADRADFWKVIKSPKQRDEVVRFFAAGIVAENPQKFGLKKDAPISTLYKNYMVK